LRQSFRLRLTVALLAAFGDISGATAADDARDDLNTFVSLYECPLAGVIEKIHLNKAYENQDRFIILDPGGPEARYVQCAFEHADHEAYCEVSSGFYAARNEIPHLGTAELQAIAALGFNMDGSHSNYRQTLHFKDGLDPEWMARFLLKVLYSGLDARKDTIVEVQAPFVTRHPMDRNVVPKQRCVLIS
jgi:hypothetical protein